MTNRRFQQGRTMTLASDAITARLIGKGQNTAKLGRWSWRLFRGKHGVKTRIISAYKPVQATSWRAHQVYNQHCVWLQPQGDQTDPGEAFLRDLSQLLHSCQPKGERIVLFMDVNDDVNQSKTTEVLASCDLHECICSAHPDSTPPPTHVIGSWPIDGIFVMPELRSIRCGYLLFNKSPGDHRTAYVNFS